MKKTRYFALGLIALAMTACQHLEETGGSVRLTALMEGNSQTKTTLSPPQEGESDVLWSTNDKIGVYMNGESSASTFTLVQGAGTATGTFAGEGTGTSYLAVYPQSAFSSRSGNTIQLTLPQEQTYQQGSFASGIYPMVAVSESSELLFRNICSIIRIPLAGTQAVSKIVFRSNNPSVKVSGKGTVNFANPNAPTLAMDEDACDSLVLNTGGVQLNPNTPTDFYLVLPAQTYKGGFTVRIYAGDTYMDKPYEADFTTRRSGMHKAGDLSFAPSIKASKYLTFTSEGTTTVGLTNTGDNAPVLYYSTDAETWTLWDYSGITFTSTAPLYICGDNPEGLNTTTSKRSKFVADGDKFAITGGIMSLIDYNEDILEIPSEACFRALFAGCTLLTKAPDLPATILTARCYDCMFEGCSNLVSAPALPAEVLTNRCYDGMFIDCVSLAEAPKLPASTLADGCYVDMFNGCNSLTKAPDLPAEILTVRCYSSMFQGCTLLASVKCLATDISANNCLNNWMDGVAASGIFVKSASMNTWPSGSSGIPTGWAIQNDGVAPITASKYLTFTSEGTSTIKLTNYNGNAPVLYHSTDKTNWTQWDYSELTFSSSAPLYICGNNPNGLNSKDTKLRISWFETSGDSFAVSGDIMSLLDPNEDLLTIPSDHCFGGLFSDCTNMTSAPSFPATTLTANCYMSLFDGCTGLTTAPALPATTLAESCYYGMFHGCTGLAAAPALPATTLVENCYREMFYGCSGLTTAPALPATTLAENCYREMFYGCSDLTTAPALPATTLAESCYLGMFVDCSGLTTAPALPATTLAQSCYFAMFQYCSELITAPALPATTLAHSCYYAMFNGCTGLTTAPALPATTLAESCYFMMFYGCTGLTTAPALPATTLAESCYYAMFRYCSELTTAPDLLAPILVASCYKTMFYECNKLNYIRCLATDISAEECTFAWVTGVSDSGTFVRSPGMNDWERNTSSGIPIRWMVLNDGDVPPSGGNEGTGEEEWN